ncbi:7390_t:CDS:2, partial [Gigaspora margarita]
KQMIRTSAEHPRKKLIDIKPPFYHECRRKYNDTEFMVKKSAKTKANFIYIAAIDPGVQPFLP